MTKKTAKEMAEFFKKSVLPALIENKDLLEVAYKNAVKINSTLIQPKSIVELNKRLLSQTNLTVKADRNTERIFYNFSNFSDVKESGLTMSENTTYSNSVTMKTTYHDVTSIILKGVA